MCGQKSEVPDDSLKQFHTKPMVLVRDTCSPTSDGATWKVDIHIYKDFKNVVIFILQGFNSPCPERKHHKENEYRYNISSQNKDISKVARQPVEAASFLVET